MDTRNLRMRQVNASMIGTDKPFYTKNPILEHPTNITFEELLDLDDRGFETWVKEMRKAMVYAWDTYGTPCRSGCTEQEISDSFKRLEGIQVSEFEHDNELGGYWQPNPDFVGKKDTPEFLAPYVLTPENEANNTRNGKPLHKRQVILNTARAGTEVDQFFHNMMKVPMSYSLTAPGYSVYDLLSKDEKFPRMLKGCRRHFRNDSFYHYSTTVRKDRPAEALINVENKDGEAWVRGFASGRDTDFKSWDFWVQELEMSAKEVSSGYYQVQHSNIVSLTHDQVRTLIDEGLLTPRNLANIDPKNLKADHKYVIRLFEKGVRVFPKAFVAFKIGYISVPTNFPPMTAKYLYERYMRQLVADGTRKRGDDFVIYDPSCGWGGRILGAMAVNRDIGIVHYVGTDPNPDNSYNGRTKYEEIADFYWASKTPSLLDPQHTYDIYQVGSETIHEQERFQQYRGKVDIVFTSPPYFNKEDYCPGDPNQSCHKFKTPNAWRDGFLRQTLLTAVRWLRPGGYILWNIANTNYSDGSRLQLQTWSNDFLRQFGMLEEPDLMMALASMPGANRLDENGIPKCENYCRVNGVYLKMEPISVWRKPLNWVDIE